MTKIVTYYGHIVHLGSKSSTYFLFNLGSGALIWPGNSPFPCGCGAWSPAAPWPSESDCAPCHRPASQSRCPRRRWAGVSGAQLQIQKQLVSGQGCKLKTRKGKHVNRQTGRLSDPRRHRKAKRQRQPENWVQRRRESWKWSAHWSWTKILTEALLSLALFHPQ